MLVPRFGAQVAKGDADRFVLMADEACAWYEQMVDDECVIRTSMAHVINGELQIKEGPLMIQETRVTGMSRRKCFCTVAITDNEGSFTEAVLMFIPFKS